jgi:hypothetical protein
MWIGVQGMLIRIGKNSVNFYVNSDFPTYLKFGAIPKRTGIRMKLKAGFGSNTMPIHTTKKSASFKNHR